MLPINPLPETDLPQKQNEAEKSENCRFCIPILVFIIKLSQTAAFRTFV